MSIYRPLGGQGGPGGPGGRAGRHGAAGRAGRGGRSGRGSADDDDDMLSKLGVLANDPENDKLFQIMCNYLSLAQFELARSVLDQLFTLSPERVVRVLRSLALTPIPQKWLSAEKVPTGAHMAWLSAMEYRFLHRTVNTADKLPHTAENLVVWQQLKQKYSKLGINPLGFMSHDRLQLEVLEAASLKIFQHSDYVPDAPEAFYVVVEVEGSKFETKDSHNPVQPEWQDAFDVSLYFADSKLKFTVFAKRKLKHPPPELRNDPYADEAIGSCVLPIHQLRNKKEYHIRVALEPPEPEDNSLQNPYAMSSQRGMGLQQVAKPNYGKLRIRVTWSKQSTLPGFFPRQVIHSLESDLLIHHAIFNTRKAYHAASRGVDDAMSLLIPPTGLLTGELEDVDISGELVPDNKPVLSDRTVNVLRQYTSLLLKDDKDSPLIDLAASQSAPDEWLAQESVELFPEVRNLMWYLPPVAFALCAKIAYLERTSSLQTKYNFSAFPDISKFQSLYAQIVAEMLLKDEPTRAAQVLYHLTHDIHPEPRALDIIDNVLKAFVSYVHEAQHDKDASKEKLHDLLSSARTVDVGVRDVDDHISREIELNQFSNEYVIRQYQLSLVMQSQVYSALIGTDHEFMLRRYCTFEDSFLGGLGDVQGKRDIPLCFVALDRALATLNKVASTLSPEDLQAQREQCLATFYADYFTFVRVNNFHVFQYAIKKALSFCRGRNWPNANIILRPFSELRPLVVLLAWDDFEDDFYAREDLITNLWRVRPKFPRGQCKEPRLIEWCNRLDYNCRLINSVVDHVDGVPPNNTDSAVARDKNDKAIRLLDTLRLHSILYSFRDFLPSLSPTVLMSTLNDPPHESRGQECDHDLHVVRSYFAVRGVLGLMLGDLNDPVLENPRGIDDNDDDDDDDVESKEEADAADKETDGGQAGKKDKRATVMEAITAHVTGMTKAEFQVTTLEKMFTLLFLQEEDLMTEEQKQRSRENQARLLMEAQRRKLEEEDRMREDDDSVMEDRDDARSVSTVDSDRADLKKMKEVKAKESPLILENIDILQVLLMFLKGIIEKVTTSIHISQKVNPSPQVVTNLTRLAALKLHIDETVWRLDVLRDQKITPTLSLLSAPMESISTIFLKVSKSHTVQQGPFPRPNHLGNQVVAERWQQLCSFVRDRARKKKKDVVNGVIDFIANYYKDPKASISFAEDETAVTTGVMQGFFFAMDVCIVFNHLLTPKAVQSLVEYAIQFLQATKPSHETPEALEIFNFYLAYAKHCRTHSRSRFELSPSYELANSKAARASAKKTGGYDLEPLQLWVSAYRMSNRAKKGAKGEMLMDGGWLTSLSGRPEDEVRARLYQSYTLAYPEYIRTLGIAGIADKYADATYALMKESQDKRRADLDDEDLDVEDTRTSPWEGFEVLNYLMDVASQAQKDYRKAVASRTYDSIDDVKDDIPERLERVSQRMLMLSKSLLPALAALRYSMRYSPEENIKVLAKIAREQSQFMSGLSRWVEWRCGVWESALKLLPRDVEGNYTELSDLVREQLSQEDVAHDQEAFVTLVGAFVDRPYLSVQEKKQALEIADQMINGETDLKGKGESLIQAILLSIIDDDSLDDEILRIKCILRLKDIVWAAQMCIKFVDRWREVELCLEVLLKCLSDLQPTHPLRPNIAFKYNLILIYQDMVKKFGREEVDAFIEKHQRTVGPWKRHEQQAVRRLFFEWQGFEAECRSDFGFVLQTMLDAGHIAPTQKLFELYKKGKAMNDSFGFELDPEVEAQLSDRIEAAIIAAMFSPEGGKASTKMRINAMRRLTSLPEHKKFNVVRNMIDNLHDAQSRFVVVEFLSRHVQRHDLAVKMQRDEEEESSLEGFDADDEDYTLGTVTSELRTLRADLRAVRRQVKSLPEKMLTEEHVNERRFLEQQVTELENLVGDRRDELRFAALSRLPLAERDQAEREYRFRKQARQIKEPVDFTQEERDWLRVIETSTKLLVMVPRKKREPFEDLYRSPSAIMRAILMAGEIAVAAKAMVIFGDYDGSEIDGRGNSISYAVAVQRRATREERKRNEKPERFSPYKFILKYAYSVLTLEDTAKGKDIGFAIFDMCVRDRQHLQLADAALDVVNGLSTKLGHHEHSLFVVHLMKNVMTYFKAKLVDYIPADGETNKRYNDYRKMVFTAQELRQIDGLPPAKKKEPLPLLYALRRIRFSLEDMRDPTRARKLRERLIQMDKMDLAKRVWVECEHRDPALFDKEVASKQDNWKSICERFDTPTISRR